MTKATKHPIADGRLAASRTSTSAKKLSAAKPSKRGPKSGAARTTKPTTGSASKQKPTTRASVPNTPAKKPLRERIRLAWHVLRGKNICD